MASAAGEIVDGRNGSGLFTAMGIRLDEGAASFAFDTGVAGSVEKDEKKFGMRAVKESIIELAYGSWDLARVRSLESEAMK